MDWIILSGILDLSFRRRAGIAYSGPCFMVGAWAAVHRSHHPWVQPWGHSGKIPGCWAAGYSAPSSKWRRQNPGIRTPSTNGASEGLIPGPRPRGANSPFGFKKTALLRTLSPGLGSGLGPCLPGGLTRG